MSETQNLTHIRAFFSLPYDCMPAEKKSPTARNPLCFRCVAVLKVKIFVITRRKTAEIRGYSKGFQRSYGGNIPFKTISITVYKSMVCGGEFMQVFSCKDYPIKIFGLPLFEKNGKLERLPDEVIEKVPSLKFFGKRCPGARLCFRTNSEKFTVKAKFRTLGPDAGMSVFSCQSFDVLAGNRQCPEFLGIVTGYNIQTYSFENTFSKSSEMEDITVFLARNEIIDDIVIEIEDNALIEPPTPYKYKPMVFYGSSITEGGCCSNVKNSYTSILSSRLNADFICLGFSGSAKGELPMADFINTIDMSVFIFDYDHNAPDVEHLEKTHEPFFKRIREVHPYLPIVIMTMPKEAYDEENFRRAAVIKQTYLNALQNGDKNVYFIDGEEFYGSEERYLCSIDGVHPNSLGFLRMANIIEPTLRKILEI